MPHQPRDTAAGLFHVFTHCVWAAPAHYRDDIDRLDFLRKLAHVTAKAQWKCVAFCLMTTHYHLIVDVADGVLPIAMHALNLSYVRNFNRRHGLRGHAQFRRYGSRRISDDADLFKTFRYVARNPVEAGLCATPAEWPWSSYAGTIGLVEQHSFVDPALILSCFRWPDVDPVPALRTYVEES
jgi:putative transposase